MEAFLTNLVLILILVGPFIDWAATALLGRALWRAWRSHEGIPISLLDRFVASLLQTITVSIAAALIGFHFAAIKIGSQDAIFALAVGIALLTLAPVYWMIAVYRRVRR